MIWKNAINLLVHNRKSSRILNEEFIRRTWDYAFTEILLPYEIINKYDEGFLEYWCEFSSSSYSDKKVEELKVLYLCGPEPENDLELLLKLGIQCENVWAVESDKETYKKALNIVKEKYQGFKLYFGKLHEFFEIYPEIFDIIYLDFTAPLFSKSQKPFYSLHCLFDNQVLTNLSQLIITTSEPDYDEDVLNFLTSYFLNQKCVEGGVTNESDEKGEIIQRYIEGPICQGLYEFEKLQNIIKYNTEAAYSAFITQYPVLYSNIVLPIIRTLITNSARKRLLISNQEELSQIKERFGNIDDLILFLSNNDDYIEQNNTRNKNEISGDLILNPTQYPLYHFINTLNCFNSNLSKYWVSVYNQQKQGVSRFEAILLRGLLSEASYGYKDILSKPIINSVKEIHKVLPDKIGCPLFCDAPLPHIWIELAINQLGFPYHINVKKHKRWKYRAKKRKMFVDSFLLDKCRSLYDWLPSMDIIGSDFELIERQIIARSCMDAIRRQMHRIVPQLYSGTAIKGYYSGDEFWWPFEICKREEVTKQTI